MGCRRFEFGLDRAERDDGGSLVLNGDTISSLGSGNWGDLTSFSDSNASDFVVGENTLEIQLTDSDDNFEAVRLTDTLNADLASSTQEPSSWLMLLGGLGVLGTGLRKQLVH